MKRLTITAGGVLVLIAGVAWAATLATPSPIPGSAAAPQTSSRLIVGQTPSASVPLKAQPSANPSPLASSLTKAAPSDLVAPRCIFGAGARASYSLEGVDSASISPRGFGVVGVASDAKVESTYSGTLETLVLKASPDGALMLGRLLDFKSTAVREDARVEAPFLFRVAQDCSVVGFAHDAQLHTGYARIQQALLHDLSFVAPSGDDTLFEGRDSLGEVIGQVKLVSEGGQVIVQKRLTSLKPWRTGLGSLSQIDGYMAAVTPSKTSWFDDVMLRSTYSGSGISSTRTLKAIRQAAPSAVDGLSRASRDEADYVWTDLLPTLIALDEGALATARELRARQAIKDHKVDDVISRMVARVDQKGTGIQDTWPELQTYLEARPEMASVIAARLIADQIPSQATMASFIALGNTRTPEARAALEGIMREPTNASFDRVRAMFSLVDRPDVGDGLADELVELAKPLVNSKNEGEHLVARHALLALGMMAGLKPGRKDLNKMAASTIRQAIKDAPNAIIASPAYGALANVGDPALLSMLDGIEHHPDYSTREVAALVTRRMPPSQTAEFTRRWLFAEKDWRVKLTLYHTLELQTFAAREMTSREVLTLAVADLEQRPGALTRKALVRLLGRAMSKMEQGDALRQRIERIFVALVPFEVERRTGLYRPLTEHLSPELIRQAMAPADKPSSPPTTPVIDTTPSKVNPRSNATRGAL